MIWIVLMISWKTVHLNTLSFIWSYDLDFVTRIKAIFLTKKYWYF